MDVNFDQARDYLSHPGSVGIMPTDTIYGLVARADDPIAVKRLYALKSREHKPGTVIAASLDQLVGLGLKRRYLSAVSNYWPGPLSVIIPTDQQLAYLHLGTFGLAVRLPQDSQLHELLKTLGPLLTSSANLPGQPPANTIKEALGYFGPSVDFYVDGGNLSKRQPSTVAQVIDDNLVVIRPGAVKL